MLVYPKKVLPNLQQIHNVHLCLHYFIYILITDWGRDSSVGIAIGYGLDGAGIDAAQVFPTRPRIVQQLVTVCSLFLCQGAVFRVPASTLHKPKTKVCWELFHIAAKCRTLILHRLWILSSKAGTLTAACKQRRRLMDTGENPPHRNSILGELHYLRINVNDMVCISPPERRESMSAFKKKMYELLCAMDTVAKGAQSMRVIRKYPLTPWERVWHNLHKAGTAEVSMVHSDS
jgi:hypothetical protein